MTKAFDASKIARHPEPAKRASRRTHRWALACGRQKGTCNLAEAIADTPALVVYDGECIFCRNFARLLRLRASVGAVELLDARSGDLRVLAYQREGYDLNQGMLFVWQGRVYHAAAAMQMLAALTTPVSWFNRLAAAVFSNTAAARLLYPVLNGGRMVLLALRGKGLIRPPPAA